MSAQDNLNQVQFYHGTNLELGRDARVLPAAVAGTESRYGKHMPGVQDYAHAVADPDVAYRYARQRAAFSGGDPHVYPVTRGAGEIEEDPYERDSIRTRGHFRVSGGEIETEGLDPYKTYGGAFDT